MEVRRVLPFVLLFVCACVSQGIKREKLIWKSHPQKPGWVDRVAEENQYTGVATRKRTMEDVLNDAYHDAVKKIAHEIGIRVEVGFERKRMENNDIFNISVKGETLSHSVAVVRGARAVETYIEKWEIPGDMLSYYYNAWVLVRVPEGEIERARDRIEKYCARIIEKAKGLWREAEALERNSPYSALLEYKTLKEVLMDAEKFAIGGALNAEVNALRIMAKKKIEALEKMHNPMNELERLKSNDYRIGEVELTDEYGYTLGEKRIFDPGEYFRINLVLEKPSYIYIIGYDRSTKEPRLLFPNRIERRNFGSGSRIYPESTAFITQPPWGLNTIFIIASRERLSIPSFRNHNYLRFTKSQMWNFINQLKTQDFDIRKIEVFIKK